MKFVTDDKSVEINIMANHEEYSMGNEESRTTGSFLMLTLSVHKYH